MSSLVPFLVSSDQSTPEQSELQQSLIDLWQKVEKKQKRNSSFVLKKDALFTQFQETVLPLEKRQGQQLAELITFLVPFIKRKTLSHYQREELLDWIQSELEFIRTHPFLEGVDYDALQQLVNDAFYDFMQSQALDIDQDKIDQMRVTIEHIFDGDMQLTDEELIVLIKDPQQIEIYKDRMYAQLEAQESHESNHTQDTQDTQGNPFEDLFGTDFDDEDFTGDFRQQKAQQATEQKQKDLDKLFKASQLNKMYKKLASLLHPDKEQNPKKKEQKHTIMQQLSEARKNKDAFTLLQLYQQHVDDGEFSFDSDTLASLVPLLRKKLHQLDDELHLSKSSNDMSTLVWRKFSASSKKKTAAQIHQHTTELENEYWQQQSIIDRHHTVAQIKKLLQQRIEEKNQSWMHDLPINFSDLF